MRGDLRSTRGAARTNSASTLARLGAWYWIGVAAGLGAAAGVLLQGVVRDVRIALPLALAAGAGAGYFLEGWSGAIAGLVGGLLAALGANPVVRGALARGGTRGGTAALVAGAAIVLAALAFVPVVGYLLALVVPAVGARLRRRQGERHAGLRILAKD
jgi:ammonia channel protein AmtB